jgi:4-hydroxyphenylpyruvate dioxygenase-like putative hemolysin
MSPDIELGLISRTGRLFLDGYDFPLRPTNKNESTLITGFDHLCLSVQPSDRNHIHHFLANVLGWTRLEQRDWFSSASNENDAAWSSSSNRVIFSVNEATDESSRSKLFTQIHHGSGWNHLCFSTDKVAPLAQILKRLELGTLALPAGFYVNGEAGELAPLHIASEKGDSGEIK